MDPRRNKRVTKKEEGLYQIRFKGEDKKLLSAILKDEHAASKFMMDIFSTLKYYHKHNYKILITFFGISFYEKYFGHLDREKEDNEH